MSKSPNLIDVLDKFSCDQKYREYVQRLRWPDGVCCTRYGDLDVLPLPNQRRWHCRGCKYQFSVISNTIMHDSHLPLRK